MGAFSPPGTMDPARAGRLGRAARHKANYGRQVESALSQSDAIAGCEVIYQSVLKLLMFMVARSLDLLAPHVLLVCSALAGPEPAHYERNGLLQCRMLEGTGISCSLGTILSYRYLPVPVGTYRFLRIFADAYRRQFS